MRSLFPNNPLFPWCPTCQFTSCAVLQKMVALPSPSRFLEIGFLWVSLPTFPFLRTQWSYHWLVRVAKLYICFPTRMPKAGFTAAPASMVPHTNLQSLKQVIAAGRDALQLKMVTNFFQAASSNSIHFILNFFNEVMY